MRFVHACTLEPAGTDAVPDQVVISPPTKRRAARLCGRSNSMQLQTICADLSMSSRTMTAEATRNTAPPTSHIRSRSEPLARNTLPTDARIRFGFLPHLEEPL